MARSRPSPIGASGAAGTAGQSATSGRVPLSPAARLTVVGLAFAAAGVILMMIAGVEFRTTIPPGLFICLIPAGLVAFGRWRWTLLLAMLAALFIAVSYVPSGSLARLLDPSPFGAFIGLWLQFVGAVVAWVAATIAAVQDYRHRDPAA